MAAAAQTWTKNSEYLIDSWGNHEGLPESAALSVAQSPDGYIWVGSNEGLLRFNGISFTGPEKFTDLTRLSGVISFLRTDRSGRLWEGGEGRVAVYEDGRWRGLGSTSTNVLVRSVGEDASGQVLLGGTEGQLYTVANNTLTRVPAPEGVKPSGVFCITDAKDGHLWLANKGFIGRRTAAGWQRLGPADPISYSLLAAPARNGGIWVYFYGELRWYQADGTMTRFPAPALDQPRELMEDRNGSLWLATITRGLTRFRPGGPEFRLNTTNGLTHNAIRCLLEDQEGNLWLGGSLNGLNRLKPRQFTTLGQADGLPENVTRTLFETAPGEITVGTHGGGIARIHGRQVEAEPAREDGQGQYVWSLLQDRHGCLWIGTFNDGLFFETQGIRRKFPLPEAFSHTVGQLMEDRHGRLWVGGSGALGIIEGGVMTACFTNSPLDEYAITAITEDPKTDAIWIGTYAHGVYRISGTNFSNLTQLPNLPGSRISSVTLDADGYLWIGVFEHGLVGIYGHQTTSIGAAQGLPANTIGSILDDQRGYFWLATTHGILRVARDDLQRLVRQPAATAVFNLFDANDGMASDYCVEGYHPSALRDAAGHLWFGTDVGVVTVDPAQLHLNTNPPPVKITGAACRDRAGNRVTLNPNTGRLEIPAGNSELEFSFDGLSYTAPAKVRFKYQLAGTGDDRWIALGNSHELRFRNLAPGNYVLRVTAANNDGMWNETGAELALAMSPFIWQTAWFRVLALLAVTGAGGFAVWLITRRQFQRRIEQLQAQSRLEQERARHAIVMENTSDLVAFADNQGRLLRINPAGRKLLGLSADEDLRPLTVEQLQPRWAAEKLTREGIPAARRHGTWETESALLHRDGHEIPVSLVIVIHPGAEHGTGVVEVRGDHVSLAIAIHPGAEGQDGFIFALARDITARKQAEAELQRRETYFRGLIEHASDSITVINDQAVVTYQSSSGERILGYPVPLFLGRNLLELIHPEDQPKVRLSLRQCFATPEVPVALVARLRHRDGTWRTIETVGTSSKTETGETQIVINSRDITENLKLQEQLQQAQKMEAVGQLAGGVAHDFNNILTSLRLQAELISINRELPETVREGLLQICADTDRAADLTRRLLLFGRRQVMQSRVLDLNQAIQSVTRMLQRIIREDIQLQLQLQPSPVLIRADAGMLDQVLINLAVNARDAMSQGGCLRIETSETTFSASDLGSNPDAAPGRYACLTVADTGGGIAPEILPRIFEPFFTTKEAGKGTGLGLATVFGIVKQHHGWIKLDNRPGYGATFHVFLPASDGPVTESATPAPSLHPQGGSETILLVEDEAAVRKATRLILERHGYRVLEAGDGAEALQLWQKHQATVVLLLTDLVMPGSLGGRELGRQLATENPRLKVIFTSGYSPDIAGRDFRLRPSEAFIQKPFIASQLLDAIRQCLDD